MAGDGTAIGKVSMGLIRVVITAIPGLPSISAIAGADGQVVITITPAVVGDVIYALYRAGSSGAWSAESASFKVTGAGDIIITGLTNGTRYQFAIYAKASGTLSQWDFGSATPTSDTTTPTELDLVMVPAALEIIDDYGRTAKFYTYTTESYDPATGITTQGSASEWVEKVTPPEGYEDKYIDGDLVQQGDKRIYLAASGLEWSPVIGIKVKLGDVLWKVTKVSPIMSGEQIALYEMQIRN